ncbi:MAG TPA: hypothetical protein VFV38_01575 [Ktedonobacteraceae bacterium]|nr:hypothetical protein [Ktedonobacteraceae bacterium]
MVDEALAFPLPTFHECRIQHGISLEALSAFVEQSIRWEVIQRFDETGWADPYTADDLLFALSELSGQEYTRANVGGIRLALARPPAPPFHPPPSPGVLSERPTLRDLFLAYQLDLSWVAEALALDSGVLRTIIEAPVEAWDRPVIERLLHLISQYTGVPYTWERMHISPPSPPDRKTTSAREPGCAGLDPRGEQELRGP